MASRARALVGLAAAPTGVSLLWLTGAGTAASEAAPTSRTEPRILGEPNVGSTLTATRGLWTGSPTAYRFQWVRCPDSGGRPDGSDCAAIGGATTQQYVLASADAGRRLRVRVTATNADGAQTAASNATPKVGEITMPVNVLGSSTTHLSARFRVTACGGRPVQGAELYATAIPYSQFTARRETTGADGWATLQMGRLRGFPANPGRQQLLVMMVRATKGGTVLGGVSTRRVVSFPVNLSV